MSQEQESIKTVQDRAKRTFYDLTKEGFFRLLEEGPSALSGPEARYYRAEKEKMERHVQPFIIGFFVGTFLFFTFRVSGSRAYAKFRAQSSGNNVTSSSRSDKKQWKSHLEQQAELKKEEFEESIRLPKDIFISFTCGCSATIWLFNMPKLLKDFAETPLLPGRSLVYQTMCPQLVEAYQKEDKRAFATKDDDDYYEALMTFETFARNCDLRSRAILERQRQGAKGPENIPYPGIKGWTQ